MYTGFGNLTEITNKTTLSNSDNNKVKFVNASKYFKETYLPKGF